MSAASLSDVSIVVLSHNRKDELARNLPFLVALTGTAGCELIVVDNASADGSPELVARLIEGWPHCRLVANAENLGVAGGRNAGWRLATRDYILNIDDDVALDEQAVAGLRDVMCVHPAWGVVSPGIEDAASGRPLFDLGVAHRRIANFQGACHMVRRSALALSGENDSSCAFGGEELDLSIRMRSVGFDVVFVPELRVVHHGQPPGSPQLRERRLRWLHNFVRLFYQHFPFRFATLLALRWVLSHVVSGAKAFGPRFALQLIRAALGGARAGLREHRPVPVGVVSFYRDPALRPDFGNVPLAAKLAGRVRRGRAAVGERAPSVETRSAAKR